MSKRRYRPWNPDQMVLFPQAMRDALDEGHIVFRIMDVVEALDITSITDRLDEKESRGTRPYHPRMMLALLMYAYCSGVYSSRKIATATYDVIPFRVLTGDQHPHFTVINEFRLNHLESFVDLFLQVLQLCGRTGLLDLEHVSLDGSKIEANASKHKAMSYGRMGSEIERLEKEIREFSDKAEMIDSEEDRRYGEGQEAHEISVELKRREERLKRIAKAKQELEAEAKHVREQELRNRAEELRQSAKVEADPIEEKRKLTRACTAEKEADRLAPGEDASNSGNDDEPPDSGLPTHRISATKDGNPKPKAQRNFTDPDSRIMKRGGAFVQGYNCQIVVDGANQIILADGVTNQASDKELLIPMMKRARLNTGQPPARLSADAGYMSEANADHCEDSGIDAYLCVGRQMNGKTEEGKPGSRIEAWKMMRAKLQAEEGKAIYARRKVIVEPVFGHAKQARQFRHFSLRGLKKVTAEWTLVCLCGNLLKLVNSGAFQDQPTLGMT